MLMIEKVVALLLAFLTCVPFTEAAADDAFFESKVHPLLVRRCYECHSGAKAKGGLSLDTRAGWQKGGDTGPAIVPGKPEESLLIEAINYGSLEMPPAEKGGKLSADDIAVLTKWVAMGAHDPRIPEAKLGGMKVEDAKSWWAFQPLPKADESPSPGKIDAFIQRELNAHAIEPLSIADKRTLIRRATFDLTGLPPTPEEVAAFLADQSGDAFANVVERLLASPQYGVQWGRHWLDVVRYADTAGENTDRPLPHAWRYRNWVFDAFNRDMRYDDFVRWQIAGDIVCGNADESQCSEGIIATGYLAIARRFGHDIDKDIHLMNEDVIDNLGKNFLGLTMGCARCHDHKYDPVTAADYYALYGTQVFAKQRGMLDDTLVVWTKEFGRTPFNNTADAKGREHHPWAFSSWPAGAGVKTGIIHGATDDIGLRAEDKPVHVHDFHATILHLMGFDHEKLTYRHAGRDYRLTDVEGHVVKEILG